MTRRSDDKPADKQVIESHLAPPSRQQAESGLQQPVRPSSPVPPPGEPLADEELAKRIRAVMESDGRVDTSNIEFGVSAGVVDLDGTVTLEFQRSLAAALVNAVPGVLVVKNRLVVQAG